MKNVHLEFMKWSTSLHTGMIFISRNILRIRFLGLSIFNLFDTYCQLPSNFSPAYNLWVWFFFLYPCQFWVLWFLFEFVNLTGRKGHLNLVLIWITWLLWGQTILIYLLALCFSYIMTCQDVIWNIILILWLSTVKVFKEEGLSLRINCTMCPHMILRSCHFDPY